MVEHVVGAKPNIWRRLQALSGSNQARTCILFLPPALLIFTLFVTWPVVEAACYSFFNWNGYGAPSKWIAFENFVRVWNDPIFHRSLFNNLLIVLVSALIQVPLALTLALLISDKSRSSVAFRAIFFFLYQAYLRHSSTRARGRIENPRKNNIAASPRRHHLLLVLAEKCALTHDSS
jgi:raffinose/stachyose/melibiose transport system permease protein